MRACVQEAARREPPHSLLGAPRWQARPPSAVHRDTCPVEWALGDVKPPNLAFQRLRCHAAPLQRVSVCPVEWAPGDVKLPDMAYKGSD